MAREPDKPAKRTILTGTAQPVMNSVERAREYLKDRPEPFRPESTKRKNFRTTKKPEKDQDEEPPTQVAENRGEGETEDDDRPDE